MSTEEQRLVTTYLKPDFLEWCQGWGLLAVCLGVGMFLGLLGAWLFLKPDTKEIVRVETPPAQVVRVEIPSSVTQPAPAPAPDMSPYIRRDELPPKTSTGEPIQRGVTVFSTVENTPGNVITGWNFKDGAAGSPPISQFCYYSVLTGQTESKRVDIAADGISLAHTDQTSVPNYDAAVQKCQWFNGAATKIVDYDPTPKVNRVITSPTYPLPAIDDNTTFVRGRQ